MQAAVAGGKRWTQEAAATRRFALAKEFDAARKVEREAATCMPDWADVCAARNVRRTE